MMIHCCILENEEIYVKQLTALLKEWEISANCTIRISTAATSSAFLHLCFEDFDVIFIDIDLEEAITGIDIARQLRNKNYSGEIIFLTNYREYVFDGYPLHALDYLLKPADYQKLSQDMYYIQNKLAEKIFVYQTRDTIFQIPFSDILYISSCNHSSIVITSTQHIKIPLTIKKISDKLPNQFIQCHRTVIVNLTRVTHIYKNELFLTNNVSVPIGRTYHKSTQNAFLNMAKGALF